MKKLYIALLLFITNIMSVQAQQESLKTITVPCGEAQTRYLGSYAKNITILPIDIPVPNIEVNVNGPIPAGVASASRKNYNNEIIPPVIDYVVFDGKNCFLQTSFPTEFYAFKLKNSKLKRNPIISLEDDRSYVSIDTKNHLIYTFNDFQYKCFSYKNKCVRKDSLDVILNPYVVGINDGVIINSSTIKIKNSELSTGYLPSMYKWLIKINNGERPDTLFERYVASSSTMQDFYARSGENPFSDLKDQYSYHITYDNTIFHIDKHNGSISASYCFVSSNQNDEILFGRAFETEQKLLVDIINPQAKYFYQTGIYNKVSDKILVYNLINDLFNMDLFGKCIGTCEYGFIYSIPVDNNFKLKEKAYEVLSAKQIAAIESVTPGHCFLLVINF